MSFIPIAMVQKTGENKIKKASNGAKMAEYDQCGAWTDVSKGVLRWEFGLDGLISAVSSKRFPFTT